LYFGAFAIDDGNAEHAPNGEGFAQLAAWLASLKIVDEPDANTGHEGQLILFHLHGPPLSANHQAKLCRQIIAHLKTQNFLIGKLSDFRAQKYKNLPDKEYFYETSLL
jgi:hypothetical protein